MKTSRQNIICNFSAALNAGKFSSKKSLIGVGVLIFLVPVLTALFYNPHRYYLTTADADLNFVYEALRLNSGLSQFYLDHTGYTLFVLLAWWFKISKALGLQAVSALNHLPDHASDAFVTAYSSLVFSARYMIAVVSGIFAVVFYWATRRLSRNDYVAAALALVFAASGGIADHALMLRTEMLSALSLLLGLTFALTAEDSRRPYLRLGLAAFCLTLAMMGKVQAIFPVLAVPALMVLAGPFRHERSGEVIVRPQPEHQDFILMIVAGLAISVPAWHMIYSSILFASIKRPADYPPYQILLVFYLIAAVIAYGWLYRKSWKEMLQAAISASVGISCAFYFHLLYHHIGAVDVLVNFVDHLYWASSLEHRTGEKVPGLPWKSFIDIIASSIGQTIGKRFAVFGTNVSPLNFLYWASTLGLAILVAKRRVGAAIVVVAMLAASILIESAFGLYKVENKALPYVEIWSILAAAMAASSLWAMVGRWGRTLVMALFAGIFVMETVNLIRVDHLYYNTLEYPCKMSKAYTQLIADGFDRYCPKPRATGGQK